MKLLVINPGSTSTKIAVYENEVPCLVRSIRHTVDELSSFSHIIDQFEFRKNLVLKELEANNIPFEFDAIVGRGGLLKPIPGGVYEVNDAMLDDILHAMRTHACNLGCLIASELAALLPGCRAFIADPGVVDELDEIARITGSPYASHHYLACAEPARHCPSLCRRASYALRRAGFDCLPLGWRHLRRRPSSWQGCRRK